MPTINVPHRLETEGAVNSLLQRPVAKELPGRGWIPNRAQFTTRARYQGDENNGFLSPT